MSELRPGRITTRPGVGILADRPKAGSWDGTYVTGMPAVRFDDGTYSVWPEDELVNEEEER